SSVGSANFGSKLASGRPMSLSISENSSCIRGLKILMRSCASRNIVATAELFSRFDRCLVLQLQRLMQLCVKSGQLLVQRLQLLLRGFQFFIGRQEFLI